MQDDAFFDLTLGSCHVALITTIIIFSFSLFINNKVDAHNMLYRMSDHLTSNLHIQNNSKRIQLETF